MQKPMSDLYLVYEIQNTNYEIKNTNYKIQIWWWYTLWTPHTNKLNETAGFLKTTAGFKETPT